MLYEVITDGFEDVTECPEHELALLPIDRLPRLEGSPLFELLRHTKDSDIDLIVMAKKNEPAEVGSLPEKLIRRITSYNVCYTKLLRKNLKHFSTKLHKKHPR